MAIPKTGQISTDSNNSLANDAARNVSRRVVVGDNRFNTFKAVMTSVGTSATLIDVPENCTRVTLYHIEDGETLWIGDNDQITVSGAGTAPIPDLFKIELEVIKGNNNNIYGIVSAGTIDVYAIGMAKE